MFDKYVKRFLTWCVGRGRDGNTVKILRKAKICKNAMNKYIYTQNILTAG